MADEVITNFNHFLAEQQEVEGKATLTLALFDDKYEMVYDEININKAAPLTSEIYYTRGMTAMNDAIGRTLTNKQRKKNAIVLIHTDGMENSSQEYKQPQIKKLVKKLKKKWEFIFVGANIDAKQTSTMLGSMRSVQTVNTQKGMQHTYAVFSDTTSAYRQGGLIASSSVSLNDLGEGATTSK